MGLLGRLGSFDRQRLGAGPGMLGNIEEDAFRAVEFLFEISGVRLLLIAVAVVLRAKTLELLREFGDVLDQHAKMMDAAVVETLAELVGLEFEDRHVEGAVAEEHAVREHPVRPTDLLEVERLLVEFSHLLRVFRGNGDVTQLGHANLLALLILQPSTTGALSKLYKPGQNGGRAHPNLDHSSRPLAGSNRESVRGSCRRVKAP